MVTDLSMVKLLETLWPKNKAKGLLAQTVFMHEKNSGIFGADGKEKIMSGCWLLAPKGTDFYKFRFCFFQHPKVLRTNEITEDPKTILEDRFRPFYAISEFMNNAGIGVAYAIPSTQNGELPIDRITNKDFSSLRWTLLSFENGKFISRDSSEFFGRWQGNRGRASIGGGWEQQTKDKIQNLEKGILTELLLNELFYSGFLKSVLKKPISDPYDIDSFLISISQQNIFPMEIKEKAPAHNGTKFFGIDAGRVMMLLRICLPNDSNAIYLIRELDDEGRFVGWKYITLSDIVMVSSWNLQAGGPGMGGQVTQTIRLPYEYFRNFDQKEISEENLKTMGNLPKDVKVIARKFGSELSSRFHK